MTRDEFQTKYHSYQTHNKAEAEAEAEIANEQAIGFEVEAVEIAPLGYCLMLKTASDALGGMGVLPPQEKAELPMAAERWYQMWVKHETADVVQKMSYCDPALQQLGSLPCAPDGVPIKNPDGTIEVRSYSQMGFRMAKQYLQSQGFTIEREQENG